jgi:hypothetical protein
MEGTKPSRYTGPIRLLLEKTPERGEGGNLFHALLILSRLMPSIDINQNYEARARALVQHLEVSHHFYYSL